MVRHVSLGLLLVIVMSMVSGVAADAFAPAPAPADLALAASGVASAGYGSTALSSLRVTNVGGEPMAGPVRISMAVSAPQLDYVVGAGWQCGIDGRNAACTHPGPVAAQSSLPPVLATVSVAADDIVLWAFVTPALDANFSNDIAVVHTTARRVDLAYRPRRAS